MAVDFDAATESVDAADPQEVAHVPGATPRGVTVKIAHGTTSDDIVNGVTYGGVPMARVRTDADTSGEPGRTYIYFLGSSIPTGTQTVSVDRTEATTTVQVVVETLTAGADTEVIDHDGVSGDVDDPSVTLQYAGRTAIALAVIYSGRAGVADLGMLSGMSAVHNHDFGLFVARADRQTTPGTGDFQIGWTTPGADDVAMSAIAVSEAEAPAGPGAAEFVAAGRQLSMSGGMVGRVYA